MARIPTFEDLLSEPHVFAMNVQNPWFSAIASGKKTVEGRKWNPRLAARIHSGEITHFLISEQSPVDPQRPRFLLCKVKDARHYSGADAMKNFLVSEGIRYVLPGLEIERDPLRAAKIVYNRFFSEVAIKEAGGFVGYELSVVGEGIKSP